MERLGLGETPFKPILGGYISSGISETHRPANWWSPSSVRDLGSKLKCKDGGRHLTSFSDFMKNVSSGSLYAHNCEKEICIALQNNISFKN